MRTSAQRIDNDELTQTAEFQSDIKSSSENIAPDFSNNPQVVFPDFKGMANIQFADIKRAGRRNAAAISSAERNALLDERALLLDKKLSGVITQKENNRLTYVRWSLDRIEDADYGAELDKFESALAQYEHFAEEVEKLRQRLENSIQRRHR